MERVLLATSFHHTRQGELRSTLQTPQGELRSSLQLPYNSRRLALHAASPLPLRATRAPRSESPTTQDEKRSTQQLSCSKPHVVEGSAPRSNPLDEHYMSRKEALHAATFPTHTTCRGKKRSTQQPSRHMPFVVERSAPRSNFLDTCQSDEEPYHSLRLDRMAYSTQHTTKQNYFCTNRGIGKRGGCKASTPSSPSSS